jgi:hypothetical protein
MFGAVALIIVLVFFVYEDFKSRTIHLYLFLPLILLVVYNATLQKSLAEVLTSLVFNIGYVSLLIGVTSSYIYFRYRRFDLFKFIGAGDLLFLFAIAPMFEPLIFVVFVTLSFVIALLGHVVFQRISSRYAGFETVPLAGYQSACMALFILFNSLN